jgi:hypothetical protein
MSSAICPEAVLSFEAARIPASNCLEASRERAHELMDDFGLLPKSYIRKQRKYQQEAESSRGY